MFENENLKTRILVTENTRVVRENYHLKQLNSGLERKLFALRSQIENILSELNECPESLKSQDEAIASGTLVRLEKIRPLKTGYSKSCQFDRQADLNKTVCSQTPPNKRRTEKVLPQTSQTDEGAEENSESNENGKNNISFPNEQDKVREESFGIQEQKDNDFQAGLMLNEALSKFEPMDDILEDDVNVELSLTEMNNVEESDEPSTNFDPGDETAPIKKDSRDIFPNKVVEPKTEPIQSVSDDNGENWEPKLSFPCAQCDFVSECLNDLDGHTNSLHKKQNATNGHEQENILYQCKICSVQLKSEASLKSHLNCHARKKGDFTCLRCDFVGDSSINLKNHMSVRHRNLKSYLNNGKYACQNCTYETSKHDLFYAHLMKHEGVVHRCQLCAYKTPSEYYLRKHMQRIHSDRKFYCDQCSHSSSRPDGLKDHVVRRHSTTKSTSIQSSSGKEMAFNCEQCSYKTHTKRYLQSHMLIHEKGTHYCDKCVFSSSSHNLKVHMRRKHSNRLPKGAEFKCIHCSLKIESHELLTQHLRKMHQANVPQTKFFFCKKCDFSSASSCGFKLHFKVHDNVTHSCAQCDYSSLSVENLRCHQRLKHGISIAEPNLEKTNNTDDVSEV